jgi:hypothetical protein
MRWWVGFVWGAGLAINTAVASASCSAVPGAGQIWNKQSVRWVFVGELHGSNEAPAAFLDLVCDALARGKHVTVALERPMSEQMALQGVLAGADLASAKTVLLDQPEWKEGMDGRASEAMLRLLLSLRELRKEHPGLAVFAFETPFTGTPPGARDEAMGHALLSVGEKKRDDVILILTGNVHAMLSPIFHYDFAAMYLPTNEVLSLEVTDRGGESWSTVNGACGPSTGGVGDKKAGKPYGIYLDPKLAPFGKVDGVLALGVPLTSSPPAAGDPTPLPACRTKFIAEHQAADAGRASGKNEPER